MCSVKIHSVLAVSVLCPSNVLITFFQLKTDHAEPSQDSSFATPPIPRITVKLEPPSHLTSVTNKVPSKAEPALGVAGSQVTGSSTPAAPKLSVKQEPSVTSAAVPKVTIKSEPLERTVVSQTLSTTFVHVSKHLQIVYFSCS